MRVSGTGAAKAATAKRKSQGNTAGEVFKLPEDSAASGPATVAGAGPLAAIDALLAVQETDDATSRKSAGLKYGGSILDLLDQVRLALLTGGLPQSALERLTQMVETRKDSFSDPNLAAILDEIDLRARVEIAKLERRT